MFDLLFIFAIILISLSFIWSGINTILKKKFIAKGKIKFLLSSIDEGKTNIQGRHAVYIGSAYTVLGVIFLLIGLSWLYRAWSLMPVS